MRLEHPIKYSIFLLIILKESTESPESPESTKIEYTISDNNPSEGEKYEDPSFPPIQSSLCASTSKMQEWGDINWKHIQYIYREKYSLFSKEIGPMNIKRGELEDDHLLSALSALSEQPNWLKRVFEIEEVTEPDKYVVRLFIEGKWENITIDGMVPVRAKTNQPIFSTTNRGDIYVLLIEKAIAKVYGNYERIIRGEIGQTLRMLTGCPYGYLAHNKNLTEDIWRALINGVKEKYILGATQGGVGVNPKTYEKIGRNTRFTYAILNASEVHVRRANHRILKIRNPWESFSWKGKWSDSSSSWTTDLKRNLQYSKELDGTFFMSFKDYLGHFRRTFVCDVNVGYVHNIQKISHPLGSQTLLLMTLSTGTNGYITLDQLPKWKMKSIKPGYGYSNVLIVLARLHKNGTYQFIAHSYGFVSEELCSIKLPKDLEGGKYVVLVQGHWRFEEVNRGVLGTYTDKPVSFGRLGKKYDHQEVKEKILIAVGEATGAKSTNFQYEDENSGIKSYHIEYSFGIFLLITNPSEDLHFKAFFRYKLINLEFVDESDEFEVNLAPGRNIVKEMRQIKSNDKAGYSVQDRYSVTRGFKVGP